MTSNARHLADTAAAQNGNVTRAQVRSAGLTNDQLRRRIRAGELEAVGRHVVRSRFVERTELSDLMALLLDCGEGALASGPTAAALHGFDEFRLLAPFHVTIPRGRFVDRAPHVVHTSIALGAQYRTLRHGLAVMTPARTLVDLARSCGPRLLTVAARQRARVTAPSPRRRSTAASSNSARKDASGSQGCCR